MSQVIEVQIPDLGQEQAVTVIDVLLSVGDQVAAEDALLTLETDKASLDVPVPSAGVIEAIHCQVGDPVRTGDVVASMVLAQSQSAPSSDEAAAPVDQTAVIVEVPDLGQGAAVAVLEIHVAPGDDVSKESPLVTLEGDKATMDVPSPHDGRVVTVDTQVGAQVQPGQALLQVQVAVPRSTTAPSHSDTPAVVPPPEAVAADVAPPHHEDVYASPAVRRLAWELGVDLHQVTGRGRKGRLLVEDVHQYVKQALRTGTAPTVTSPGIDVFAQFGEVTTVPLTRVKQLTGQHMSACWQTIPQVTHFDEADITELEAYRQQHKDSLAQRGHRLTPVVFVMKALAHTLADFPTFNASLEPSGQALILKQYVHIGVAVDTPQGLLVPVVRDVNQKGLLALSQELMTLSEQARQGELKSSRMQGGCITISSLGGIGGTAFTPIVNAPEVAILGLSKAYHKPVYQPLAQSWQPRLMLPLALSYDHRVIDGAEAARFCQQLSANLSNLIHLLL